jgi:PAS domain S-box-containing protein
MRKVRVAQPGGFHVRAAETSADAASIDGQNVANDVSAYESFVGEPGTVTSLKEQYHLVLRMVHDAICLLDARGVVRYVNPAFERLFQLPLRQVVGHMVTEIIREDTYERVVQTKRPVFGQIIRRTSGQDIVLDMVPVIVNGALNAVVCVSRRLSMVEEFIEQVCALEGEQVCQEDGLAHRQPLSSPFKTIIGQSGALADCLFIASKAAKTKSTVFITGESGTGKELLAKAIHLASPMADGPFVRVNCAGIPVALIESELFGHERGAFTGAFTTRKGKFELAQNGTIFLDEIGELPVEVQAKLLRVLQEREVERIGGECTIPLNVRVIAATNRDVEAEVARRAFREDLYYRINVVRIHMPPLRDRTGDIPLLVHHFVRALRDVVGKEIRGCTKEALTLLMKYPWPGNVRELRNVLERAMIVSETRWIQVDDLPLHIRTCSPQDMGEKLSSNPLPTPNEEPLLSMEEYERNIIARALREYGSFNRAAKALGLTHKTVARKARQFGLVKSTN